MKARFILGASAGAIALAGAGVEIVERRSGAPFVSPIDLAGSACGGAGTGPGATRAYFISVGRALAAGSLGDDPGAAVIPMQVGSIAYRISTAAPAAQAQFDAGLAHMWNFNHGAAVAAFREAQRADPACAMCFWGEALALGPNINAPMAADDAPAAWAAVRKAVALKGGADAKEQMLIDALAARYAEKPPTDRSALDAAFADAMDKVAAAYPDDDFIAVLSAEANMDTQPWDYWETDGRTPKGRTARTLSLIEAVLARNPDHVAAIHLYIHITENTSNPYRAAPFAERLGALSPGLGHLVHMPSHTYYKIGRFKESIAANIEAVAADEAELAKGPAHPMYEFGYYVHNIHFVMTSAMMAGDAETSLAMAAKLDAKLPTEMAAGVPFAQPIKAAPYFAQAMFGDPETILALEDPGPDVPFLQGLRRYARGEAEARRGNAAAARAEADAIAALLRDADFSALEGGLIPVRDILEIARLTVIARASDAEGDLAGAIEAMEEAVALQDGLNYTEPPYWYYPARQTLAALVLKQGDAERAEALFLETLVESPNNGWALYGLSEAYRAQGDRSGAKYAAGLFKDAWAGAPKALTLARL